MSQHRVRASAYLEHDVMMSLFQPSSVVAQTSDSLSSIPLSVVREMIKEVAKTRADNLDFRQAVSNHEAANSAPSTSSQPVSQSGRRLKSGGGRGGGGGGTNMAPSSKADLKVKPPTLNIPKKVPRQVSNKVVWDLVKVDTPIITSASVVTETNFFWSLGSHPQSSAWISLFDQWCIPQASVTFRSMLAPGSTVAPVLLYTALDFDGVANLGTVTAIEDFATCSLQTMGTTSKVTRSIKPCVKTSVQQNGTNVNSGVLRQWQDSGAAGTPWYGIRSIASSGSVETIIATSTIWFAFRNQI